MFKPSGHQGKTFFLQQHGSYFLSSMPVERPGGHMLLGPRFSSSPRARGLQSSLEVCPAEGLEVQRPSLVNRPCQQTVLMQSDFILRHLHSHLWRRQERAIHEKVETRQEYSSGKGPGFDPLASQKTEKEARRGRQAEGGRGLFCSYTAGRWLKLGLSPHLWCCTGAPSRTQEH